MELMNAIAARRSTRSFTPRQVDDEDIQTILKAACCAPVANGEAERVRLVVVQNRKLLERISDAACEAFGMPWRDLFYDASTVIFACVKPRDNEPNIEIADAACVVENMLLAATGLGLANVYMWGFRHGIAHSPTLLKEFGLPEGYAPVSAAAIGYTDALPPARELAVTLECSYIK